MIGHGSLEPGAEAAHFAYNSTNWRLVGEGSLYFFPDFSLLFPRKIALFESLPINLRLAGN